MRLPYAIRPSEFDAEFRLDSNAWAPAVAEVCRSHGLPKGPIEPFADGSNLVAAVGADVVVKVFPPFHRYQWESERTALPRFTGRLPVRVPQLLFEGEREDGYTYLVLERLPGRSLEAVWPHLAHDARLGLLQEIGAAMAAAHTVELGSAAALEPEWGAFLAAQIAGCRARHARLAAPDWVVEEVDAFVAEAAPRLRGAAEDESRSPWSRLLWGTHVLLTGEYTPFNLLVDEHAPRLTGMIDFGDAQVGAPAYDLLGPLAFLCAGDRTSCAAFFHGRFGAAMQTFPDAPTQRTLLALLLLHRYSNLDAQLRVPGWRDAGSFEALTELFFGTSSDPPPRSR